MSRFIGLAGSFFRKHPFLANSAIYGSLYVGAEYSQQLITKRLKTGNDTNNNTAIKEDIDYANIGRYAIMGTMIYAPSLYTWYKWLDGKFQGTARPIIIKKLILDQFILTPYLLTVFYTGMSLMEHAEDPFLELREKFIPTFARSCAFWFPAQAFNFMIIPPRFRLIYMGVCGFIWANILCWIKRQSMQETSPNEKSTDATSAAATSAAATSAAATVLSAK